MISWGLIASAMMFVHTPVQFYGLRVLLGVAEAGFFPGIVYYMTHWFPAAQRARAISRFIMAVPLSAVVGNPLAGWLLGFDGSFGGNDTPWRRPNFTALAKEVLRADASRSFRL